ncbi:TPA: SMI1/KNR4 family protein [Pseudomonas aeruginosa]
MELSPAERQLLLAHRLAVFDGCVVYDAQPPVSAEHVQRLAEGLAGPIPEDLLRLWRTCFGERLGYDLEVDYDGHRHPFSFSELFYPDSDGYHDLWGWIEHERELAAEAAAEEGCDWNGKLAYLPFGGFEYLERLYVCVEPGPEYGAVIAWSHGLPPAWAGRLHQDSVTRLADDVGGLFRLLSFEQDPFDAENACGVADELLEALDALEAAGEPGKALKGRLEVLLRQRILDWRPALADGSLAAEPRLRQLALAEAAQDGDIDLLQRLRDAGCDFAETLRGRGGVLEACLARGRLEAAGWLLDQGVAVHQDSLQIGAAHLDAVLAERLLRLGAVSDPNTVLLALQYGDADAARIMARPLLEESPAQASALRLALASRAERERSDARRVRSGKMGSNRSPDDYLALAERLERFLAELPG